MNVAYLPHSVCRDHVCIARLGLEAIDIFDRSILDERGRFVSHYKSDSNGGSPIVWLPPVPLPSAVTKLLRRTAPKSGAVLGAFDSLFHRKTNGIFKASCLGLYSLADIVIVAPNGDPLKVCPRPMGRS